jgi:probable F420-dependent oxidoreductase
MQLGLNLPVVDPTVGPQELIRLAVHAERLGYQEIYLGEHVVLFDEQADAYLGNRGRSVPFPPTTNLPDPLVTLAFLAAATERIRIATGVLVLPQRNPVYAAKHAATVDWLSGGRLDLAVGIGWSELEFVATATPWERRGARCDEYVDLMRALWRDGTSAHEGEFYSLATCYQYPKPVQRPGPPIWFGGASDAALRHVASRGDGWYLFDTTPSDLRKRLDFLNELLTAQNRSEDDVAIILGTMRLVPRDREDVLAYAEVGVDQIVVSLAPGEPADRDRQLSQLAERILG